MPIKQNGYTHAKADARRDKKRQEAEAGQRAYDSIPLAERLATMGKKHKARYDKQQAEKAKKPAPVAVLPTVAPAEAPKAKKKNYQKPNRS